MYLCFFCQNCRYLFLCFIILLTFATMHNSTCPTECQLIKYCTNHPTTPIFLIPHLSHISSMPLIIFHMPHQCQHIEYFTNQATTPIFLLTHPSHVSLVSIPNNLPCNTYIPDNGHAQFHIPHQYQHIEYSSYLIHHASQ